MPQSLSAMYLHLVFSTRGRRPWLTAGGIREEVHAYLGATSNRTGYQSIIIGGVSDHVHILACQSRTKPVATWVNEMKSNSTKWIRSHQPSLHEFSWQEGYGVFSVSESDLVNVRQYIADQEQHHKVLTFQEEFLKILEEHSISWDKRYIWD